MSIIIPKEVRKKVASIFEHPNNVYSIYLKDDTEKGCNFIVLLPNVIEENVVIKEKESRYKSSVDRISIEFADIYELN